MPTKKFKYYYYSMKLHYYFNTENNFGVFFGKLYYLMSVI